MGLTRVDLYNMALGNIKVADRVAHIDDENAHHFLLPQAWELVTGMLFSRRAWSFATVHQKLSKIKNSMPRAYYQGRRYPFEWEYPSACCLLLDVGRVTPRGVDFTTTYPFRKESGENGTIVLLTMHDHAIARYVSNAIPETRWPASFVAAVSWGISAQIVRSVNASDSEAESCLKQANQAYLEAEYHDSLETDSAPNRNGSILESRHQWGDPDIGDEERFSDGSVFPPNSLL